MADARKSQDPDHYERRGQIQMAANVLALAQKLEPGDLLNLKLFPDKPYRIVVQSRHEKASGIITITGQLEDHEMETFVMTLNAEHYTISLQDLVTDKSYWISGETGPGRGSVLEVNQKTRPPRFE